MAPNISSGHDRIHFSPISCRNVGPVANPISTRHQINLFPLNRSTDFIPMNQSSAYLTQYAIPDRPTAHTHRPPEVKKREFITHSTDTSGAKKGKISNSPAITVPRRNSLNPHLYEATPIVYSLLSIISSSLSQSSNCIQWWGSRRARGNREITPRGVKIDSLVAINWFGIPTAITFFVRYTSELINSNNPYITIYPSILY